MFDSFGATPDIVARISAVLSGAGPESVVAAAISPRVQFDVAKLTIPA
jgi:hypothetical protein